MTKPMLFDRRDQRGPVGVVARWLYRRRVAHVRRGFEDMQKRPAPQKGTGRVLRAAEEEEPV